MLVNVDGFGWKRDWGRVTACKRSAGTGTVTCAPKGAVTPRGSRPLFY
jgi:hypothetical protein